MQLFDSFVDIAVNETKRISTLAVDNNSKRAAYHDEYVPEESKMKSGVIQALGTFYSEIQDLGKSRVRGVTSNDSE